MTLRSLALAVILRRHRGVVRHLVTDPGRILTMQVDRVAYTRPGDTCQFTGSIACA